MELQRSLFGEVSCFVGQRRFGVCARSDHDRLGTRSSQLLDFLFLEAVAAEYPETSPALFHRPVGEQVQVAPVLPAPDHDRSKVEAFNPERNVTHCFFLI